MEKTNLSSAIIEIDWTVDKLEEPSPQDYMSKQEIISLLQGSGVQDTIVLENPEVKVADIIPTLRKAKVNVPEGFFRELASETNFSFVSQTEIRKFCRNVQESKFLTILPYRVVVDQLIIPIEITQNTAKIALANPFNRKAMTVIRILLGNRHITWYLASSKSIDFAVEKVYGEIQKQTALLDLCYRSPNESAHKVLFRSQKYFLVGVVLALVAAALFSPILVFSATFAAVNLVYFIINPLKIYISFRGFQKSNRSLQILTHEINSVKKEELPVYTILIPVYHEASVLGQVMKNVFDLTYPKEKLDVKILMEEKDEETIQEAKNLGLFGDPKTLVKGIPATEYRKFLEVFDPIIVPKSDITTKPRACNYGLLRAKGKYCVIYDAEDKPERDQLLKAIITFDKIDKNIVCLQSRLNFYNAKENLLTRWFSMEYSYWFDFYLGGLEKVGAPIPLGGTSNHFRVDQLKELGAWDPYNVTEDADLGVRMSRQKLKTSMLDSYTYEEATLKVGSWTKQRSRWYKGHVQTYLVHMRHPLKLFQELGWRKFILLQLTFGGNIFMPIVNPMLWIITAVSIFAPWAFGSSNALNIQVLGLFNLIVGNSAYLLLYLAACIKMKNYRFAPLSIAMPAYWVMISVASWRGLFQLLTKPFYWDKTQHGVSTAVKTNWA